MSKILNFFDIVKNLKPILQEIIENRGKPYLVGGTVRDLVLERETKDVDIEVHGISLGDLEKCLRKFGYVKLVGKKFGVLKLADYDVDWSLPRKDTKGRKPKVEIDPNMTIEQACKRRDLTMNAMAVDLEFICKTLRQAQGERVFCHFKKTKDSEFDLEKDLKIIDPYGGLQDIKEKKLKAVDTKLFLEDPLRFFRVMQFIGRFEMEPDKELNDLCENMDFYDATADLPLAKERIYEEIKKLFLKSKKPSLGFRWLKKIERLKEVFLELYAIIGVAQRPDYHPEGDVFEHTMQTLDAAAVLDKYENEDEKFLIMLGALCHDLGKAIATDEDLHAKGHDKEGVALAKKLLKRFMNDKFLIDASCKLVRYHTKPFLLLKQKSSLNAYKRLALKISPELSLRQLALVSLCDIRGRNPKGHEPLADVYEDKFDEFMQKVKEAQLEKGPEKPVLLGRHLFEAVKPGPEMGKLLKEAYEIQIEEGIKDWEELRKRVLSSNK